MLPQTIVFDNGSKLGDYRFPLISNRRTWQIQATKFQFGQPELLPTLLANKPALRMVKDDGVTDLYCEGGFKGLCDEGLIIKQPLHAQTTKRLSRVFRPSLAFNVFKPEEMVVEELDVDTNLWDGMNLITRKGVQLLTQHLPERIQESFEKVHRFEGTVMTEQGQGKGHFMVVNKLPNGGHIGIPKNSWKTQIAFRGVFVDMRPVHGHVHLLADIQTLINIYHDLFSNSQLMSWMHEESVKFLTAMQDGKAEERFQYMLGGMNSETKIENIMKFTVFEFLASGGKLHQSATMTRQFGKAWINKLTSMGERARFPIKAGFRLYLAAAAVRSVSLKQGECKIDFLRSTIYVSDAEYDETCKTLGGADQDDAVNCIVGWADETHTSVKLLASRNPNTRGEFMVYTLVNPEDLIEEPLEIDWKRLDKINKVKTFGELEKFSPPDHIKTYPEFVNWLMVGIMARLGTLGRHINMLTAHTLTFGEEPTDQPASTEAIIDATVKDLTISLKPVIAWDKQIADLLKDEPLCRDAARRVSGFTGGDFPLKPAENHWLDALQDAVEKHIKWFSEQVKNLADKATPHQLTYAHINEQGRILRATYNYEVRKGIMTGEVTELDFKDASEASLKVLGENPLPTLLAAYALSGFEGSDACVWQKELAHMTFAALREIGVLVEPIFDECGYLPENVPTSRLQHTQINGTWFSVNQHNYAKMGDVPRETRDKWKLGILNKSSGLVGRTITFVAEDERLICKNDKGVLLGYVQKGTEDRLQNEMVVIAATANDGNLRLVLK